jgi:hypothetical protein
VPDGHDQVGPPDGVQDLGGIDRGHRRGRGRCEVVDDGGRDVLVGAEMSAAKNGCSLELVNLFKMFDLVVASRITWKGCSQIGESYAKCKVNLEHPLYPPHSRIQSVKLETRLLCLGEQ